MWLFLYANNDGVNSQTSTSNTNSTPAPAPDDLSVKDMGPLSQEIQNIFNNMETPENGKSPKEDL